MPNLEDVSHSNTPVNGREDVPRGEPNTVEAGKETEGKGEELPEVSVEAPVVPTAEEKQTRIDDLTKTIERTNEELARVREGLGLPSAQQADSHSVAIAKENLAQLNAETEATESTTESVFEESIKQLEIVEPKKTVPLEEIEKWNSDGYKVETYGPDISVAVLGEYHYDKDMKAKQVELIKAIKPEFVLYEGLSGFVYDPTKKSLERQEGRLFMDGYDGEHFKSPKEMEFINVITSSADEVGCNVVGCDLTFAEQGQVGKELAKSNPDKYIFDEEFNVLQRRDNPNYTILGTDIEYMKARDNKMAEMIIEYQKKSQQPIVVIVGNRHASNIHDQKKLQEQGFGYVYISPTKPSTKSGMYS